MYLINYDFHDIYSLIVFFRTWKDRFEHYKPALAKITEYIDSSAKNELDYNIVRKILRPYFVPEDSFLSWINTDNMYTANVFIVKKEVYYSAIKKIFNEMSEIYQDKQRLYLLCDAVHNIPLLFVEYNKKLPKNAIKNMLKDYRKQYNKDFLTELDKV